MYMNFTLFNWTNPQDVHNHDIKPVFSELGPYVFLEQHSRNAIVWNDENSTVSFNQTRRWHFMPELSGGRLDDQITNLNVISAVRVLCFRNERL